MPGSHYTGRESRIILYVVTVADRREKRALGLYWCRKCLDWVPKENMWIYKKNGVSSGLCKTHWHKMRAEKAKQARAKKKYEKERFWWKHN